MVAPSFCNGLAAGVGEGPRARAVVGVAGREGEDLTVYFEEEEIAVVYRANMMDQDRKPWQGFMMGKLGSQADFKIVAPHGCFALHNEFVSSWLWLSIAGIISVTWDTFAHDYPEYFAPCHISFLRL